MGRSFVLNVQGDEPFASCADLKKLMIAFQESQMDLGTLAHRSDDRIAYDDPNTVKVVIDGNRRGLYFSRSPLPYVRTPGIKIRFWAHQGIYAYRLESLAKFCQLPVGYLEDLEKLEQLRALENGMSVLVVEAAEKGFGIDTPADLARAEGLISRSDAHYK
jgi:3-deoxy-manno-octulosonate cytidylyltransferase (CMP-KDO synthetase)